jgi:hypothetical protein
MIRTILAALLASTVAVHADDPNTITLSCAGTVTQSYGSLHDGFKEKDPGPIEIGVVVNFDEGTLYFGDKHARLISAMRAILLSPRGRQSQKNSARSSKAALIA